ncbi:MAG: DUF4394 domain-containing protein [Janthinobacterium lividum]
MTRSRAVSIALLLGGAASADAATVDLLDIGNRLVTIDSAAPGTITSTVALTGLPNNQTLLDIDYRPSSPRVLYGVSNLGQVYAINPLNGSATAVGTPTPINGTAAGIDFNPAADHIRVVTNTGQNLRLNPDTGAALGVDTPIAYAAGDAGAGTAPRIVAAAHGNNVAAGTPTTLYVIDANRGVLATQGSATGAPVSPNSGQLFTVGALGVATNDKAGFDIARDGTVLATLTQPGTGTTSLYSVNLTTGAATLIGAVGAGGHTYAGLAIAAPTIASYGITANQIAVGGALDNFTGVPSAALNTAFVALDGLSPAGRAAALSQLTPSAYSLLPELTLQTVEFTETTIRRYLRDFRAGGTGVNGTAGIASPGDRKFGSFLVASGRTGHFDADTDRAHVGYSAASVMGGIDYRFGARSLIGVMGGYDSAKPRLGDFVRESEIRNYFGGAYATVGLGPLYLDGFGTYGKGNYDLRRGVAIDTDSLDYVATTKSRTYVGGGTAGLSFSFAGVELEPFAGARYAHVLIDGFNEGAGFGALTLSDEKYQSVLGTAGLRAGLAFAVGGATVRPEIRGAYRHEFRNDRDAAFTYGFGGVGATPTELQFIPTALRRSYYSGGAGFTVSGAASPLSLVVDYNGEYDRDRQIHGVTGGLRYTF